VGWLFRSSRLWNLLMKCSYTMTNTNCWTQIMIPNPVFVILSWIWHTAPIQIEIHNIDLNIQTNNKKTLHEEDHIPQRVSFHHFHNHLKKPIARLCNKHYDHLVKWKFSSYLSSSSSSWTLYANLKQLLLKYSSL
jgi:hypothetical protein